MQPAVIPHVPVRQWVLSLPIPLRLLLAAQPLLVTPVLQVVHRATTRFLLQQAGLKAEHADSGAVTLIQRFGSESESFSDVPERRAKAPLVKAQSTAIARAMASICNAEQGCLA